MVSDSILNASLPALSKELGKKKRTNKLAKIKQKKLDVRREQWLSLGIIKNEACKVDASGRSRSPPSLLPIADEGDRSKDRIKLMSNRVHIDSLCVQTDLESLMSFRNSISSGQDDSMKDFSLSSSSSASSRCCSGSVSEADEDEGCLDDWEAIADALTAEHNQNVESPAGLKAKSILADHESPQKNSEVRVVSKESNLMMQRSQSRRAWSPDDVLRPQGLPDLSKQCPVTMKTEQLCSHGTLSWGSQSFLSQPSSCPICYEDLDLTDSLFLPCSCGFRLCLFCHKRIIEADGKCPGCRKQYMNT